MTDEGQELFRLNPFGRWLDFTHNAHFSIGPHLRRFGREEFMLLTGLPFGSRPSLSHRDGNAFVWRLFPRSVLGVPRDQPLRLKISDLLDMYNNMSGLDDEDAVRICSLVMVEKVLLGRQRHHDVNDVLLNVVHDLAVWNK